jgi:hypothetical protein
MVFTEANLLAQRSLCGIAAHAAPAASDLATTSSEISCCNEPQKLLHIDATFRG